MKKPRALKKITSSRLSRRQFLKGSLALGIGLSSLRFGPLNVLNPSSAQAAGSNLVWGPYLQSSTSNSVTVAWATSSNSVSEVRYSIGGGAESAVTATAQRITKSGAMSPFNDFYIQSAKLTGLAPGSTYNYRILTGGSQLGTSTLKPARSASETAFSFVVIGDSGMADDNQKGVAARIQQLNPEFILHCGDIIGYDTNKQPTVYQEWHKKFFDIYKATLDHIPLYPAIGNHDFQDYPDGLTPYLNVFYLPENVTASGDKEKYYSFDYGNAHFAVIDVYAPYGTGSAQQNWLIQDLQSTNQFWKIVWMQTGPYSSNAWSGGIPGGSEASANMNIRNTLVPIFQQYNVDIVFAGDQHIYERSVPWKKTTSTADLGFPAGVNQGGVVYVITGGGGAGLGDVQTGSNRGAWSQNGAMFKLWHATKITIDGPVLTGEAYDQGATPTSPFDTFTIDRTFEVANGLLYGSVTPETGGAETTYTFQVTYKNSSNLPPSQAKLMLNDQPLTMTQVSGTFSAGAVYRYQASINFGTHQFYFDFGPGYQFPSTGSIAKPMVNDPPEVPAPITPAPGETNLQPANLTLSWSGGDPNIGAGDTVKYDLYLGTPTLPTTPLQSNLTATSYTPIPGTLSHSATYYWKVVARDSTGATSAPAAPWSFTTISATQRPPTIPSNPDPADNAVDVDPALTLSWNESIDPDGDPVTYDVTFQGVLVASGRNTPSYSPSNLAYGATYSWQVTARSIGGPTIGPVWHLTTRPDRPPQLSQPSVEPGETAPDEFVFHITYADPYGRPARESKIYIDDVPLSMTPDAVLAGASIEEIETTENIITGIGYAYRTQLAAGVHTYRFEFINQAGGIAKDPQSGSYNVQGKYVVGLPFVKK
jgi:hypothetical protein